MPAQLFQPFTAGTIDMRNRVVAAQLTRNRVDHEPGEGAQMQVDYDCQRAGAGHTDIRRLKRRWLD